METGKCHLCGKMKYLHDSHVWPKFAYKRYAADVAKGGRFADLFTMTLHNKQYTLYWFCTDCEEKIGVSESSTARLCSRIEEDPDASQPYDENFLKFASSMSWRTLKFYHQDKPNSQIERKWHAAKIWKQHIRGTRGGVSPFSQHVFVINDNPHGFDKFIGGMVAPDNSLVLSQIGPLLIVGQLMPELLSVEDKAVWRASQIPQPGGTVKPLRRWVTGYDPKSRNITVRIAFILGLNQQDVLGKVASANWSGKSKPPLSQ